MIELDLTKKKSIALIKEIPFFDELLEKMTSSIISTFDEIISDRIQHHANFQFTKIDEADLKRTYNTYANKDGLMNGLGNIIPGGSAYFTMLPLIINSYKNQIKMVCDLAVKLGKKDALYSKEIVLAILLSTAGDSANQIITSEVNKIIIQKISASLMPKLMENIGTNLLTKSFSSVFTSAVPGIGALAIGMFFKYNTKQLGKKCISILSKDIQFTDQIENFSNNFDNNTNFNSTEIKAEVIKVFLNLMKVDSNKQSNEIGYLTSLIKYSDIDDSMKITLYESISDDSIFYINYDILKMISDKNLFVFDMLAFCSIDNNISMKEIAYVSKILKILELGTIDDYIV